MTNPDNRADKPSSTPEQGANKQSETSPDPSASRTQAGSDDAVSQEARREALRNASHGDQFVVATDLEDNEQREAAPGTREQD